MKLLCPICMKPLVNHDRRALCENNHSFDYAASGYVNLLRKEGSAHGDDAAMILARTRFLSSGSYEFLRNELASITVEKKPSTLVDLGCGEGYYTAFLQADEKYGFDLSKAALKHASKKDKQTQYVLSSIFHLPLPDACADEIVTCFAPVAEEEITRLLKPGGIFVLVTPGPDHLFELKEQLYDTPYKNQIKEMVYNLPKVKDVMIEHHFEADQPLLQDLFRMTPYAWRTGTRGKAILAELSSLTLKAQFHIRIYCKDTGVF